MILFSLSLGYYLRQKSKKDSVIKIRRRLP